jgi:uncharacterized membrane protein YkoI
MAGHCRNAADQNLLIYVSILSGRFRHGAGVKNRQNTLRFVAAAVAAQICVAPSMLAAGERDGMRQDDLRQDDMRQAVERGEIRSLADILARLRGKLPGEVAGVEIERKNGRWLYEFRVVDDKGRLFEVRVDAKTAAIERTKEK